MEVITSAVDLSPLAEAVAVALVAHQGEGATCEVSRPQLAAELRVSAARVSLAIAELVAAGLVTVTRRAGYPSSFSVALEACISLAAKANEHRIAFPVETPRMTARQALRIVSKARCHAFLDERGAVSVTGPAANVKAVFASLEAANVFGSLRAWLEEHGERETAVLEAAGRLLVRRR